MNSSLATILKTATQQRENARAQVLQSLGTLNDPSHLWVKYGHANFALLRLDTPQPQLHPTRLTISADECLANQWPDAVRSQSRVVDIDPMPGDGINQLLTISQQKPGGVFFIPTQPDELPLKAFVAETDDLGCEIDNCDRTEQLARYKAFTEVSGLEFASLLSSGSKSIHAHIKANQPYPIAEMMPRRRAFILAMHGDPAVARPHQPMRMAGFYRKEKSAYQELLHTSTERYSLEEIDTGLAAAFAANGWPTDGITQGFTDFQWGALQRLLKADLNFAIRSAAIKAALLEPKERPQQQGQKATFTPAANGQTLNQSSSLFDAVKDLERQLSPAQAFSAAHDWQHSSSTHARGYCQWHQGSSNSAWISQGEGGWSYHCPTCTNDKPVGAFAYWHRETNGSDSLPRGKDWAAAAKAFLAAHGIDTAQFDKPLTGVMGQVQGLDRKVTSINKKKNAKKQQLLGYLATFCKRLGIEASGNEHTDRTAIEAELRKRQTLPANHVEGWFGELPVVADGARKMYVLDGQKRTGKTSGAISRLPQQYGTGLVVCPTRVLARSAAEVLGIGCYMDGLDQRWMTICPESLHKVADRYYDCVIFDESNEDTQRTQDGSLGTNPTGCRKALQRLLPAARCVVVATDATYRPTVAAAQRIGGFSPDEVEVIQRRRAPSRMHVSLYLDWPGEQEEEYVANTEFYNWFDGIVQALRAGKKVLIPCGSQTKARLIGRALKAYFPELKGQVLDGKYTPSKVKKQFALDPNGWPQQQGLNWLAYTPVFNSGLSFEGNYWNAQFEYITPFETATAASQRGERLRTLLDGTIIERHVFISNRGLPGEPDIDLFFPEFWRDILTGQTKLSGGAKSIGEALGVIDAMERKQNATLAELDQLRELPEFWAIQAREVHFKLETLTAEWEGNGWDVVHTSKSLTAEKLTEYKGVFSDIHEGVIGSQARSLSKATGKQGNGDDGPIAAVKDRKWRLCEKVGHSFQQLTDAEWIKAWEIAPGTSGGINAIRIRALVKMSTEQPELWRDIQYIDALKTVALSTIGGELPKVPATSKEIAIARLLADCPGVAEIVSGALTVWSKATEQIKQAAFYLRSKAMELARLSAHHQRIHGLAFTPDTPDIKCMHKALSMLGSETTDAGRAKGKYRYHQYRLETADDVELRIMNALADPDTANPTPDDHRHLKRALTTTELMEQVTAHIESGRDSFLNPWQQIAEKLAETGCPELQLLKDLSTEVLDKAKILAIFQGMRSAQSLEDLTNLANLSTPEQRQGAWDVLIGVDREAALRIEKMAA